MPLFRITSLGTSAAAGKALLMAATLSLSATMTVLSPSPAAAQSSDWVNPAVISLQDRVRQLEAQVQALGSGGRGNSGAVAAAPSSEVFLRLSQIEDDLRRINGQLEQLQYQQRRAQGEQERSQQDMKLRLEALEAAVNGETPTSLPPASAAPSAPSGNDQGSLRPQNQNRVQITRPAAVSPQNQQAAAADALSNLGSRPGTLGTLRSTQQPNNASAGPIYDSPAQGATPSAALGEEAAFRDALDTLRNGNIEGAQAKFQSYVTAFPGSKQTGDAYYWLGETHYVRGRYDQAATSFLTSFRDHPKALRAPDSLLKLGITMAQLGKPQEACLTFGQLGKRFPDASSSVKRRTQVEAQRAGCQ
ncbi:MAG: tol-pal system protein YbgF [Neomegalonema sp.]|nr:tol-pal system protein YbgF [Neomegalonema sp.]